MHLKTPSKQVQRTKLIICEVDLVPLNKEYNIQLAQQNIKQLKEQTHNENQRKKIITFNILQSNPTII